MSEENNISNHIVWCDIPVIDLERACDFYSQVLDVKVEKMQYDDLDLGVFYHQEGNGACLMPNENEAGQLKGPLIYFNVTNRIEEAVDMVSELGGQLIEDIHSLGEYGFRAVILDSEGNRIALHSEA